MSRTFAGETEGLKDEDSNSTEGAVCDGLRALVLDENVTSSDESNLISSRRRTTATPEQCFFNPSKIQSVEPKTIVLIGLDERTTFDTIKNFIEAKTQEKVLDIGKFGKESALVTLENISGE
jgi:hypothetical protein